MTAEAPLIDVVHRAMRAVTRNLASENPPPGGERIGAAHKGEFAATARFPTAPGGYDIELSITHRGHVVLAVSLGPGWERKAGNIHPRTWEPSEEWLAPFAELFEAPPKSKVGTFRLKPDKL